MTPITHILVYWDTQDPQNEGWAVRWWRGEHEESDSVDTDGDLDDAIGVACHQIDADPDISQHFGREEEVDGGFAEWSLTD